MHVRDYALHAASDEEILDKASMERRVVIAADTDFGTPLATRRTWLPSVVLFRRGTQRRPEEQATLLLANLPAIEQALGRSITALDNRSPEEVAMITEELPHPVSAPVSTSAATAVVIPRSRASAR